MRLLVAISGLLLAILFGLTIGGCGFLLPDDIPPTPFTYDYSLIGGEVVTVSGEITHPGLIDNDGDTNYRIYMKRLGGSRELVSSGSLFNGIEPRGPFHLGKSHTEIYLASDCEIYHRPLNSKSWQKLNCQSDLHLPYFGRAIMPGRYACKKFEHDGPEYPDSSLLPPVPPYAFERWDLKKNLVVFRQCGGYYEGLTSLWPTRLVFHNWDLDLKKTLLLEPKFYIRPLPHHVTVEFMGLSFADYHEWEPMLEKAMNGTTNKSTVAKIWGREKFKLTRNYHMIPLSSRKPRSMQPKIYIRGLCADPNNNLLHYQWKGSHGRVKWAIAHNGEWSPIHEASNVSETPHLFARFTWNAYPNGIVIPQGSEVVKLLKRDSF